VTAGAIAALALGGCAKEADKQAPSPVTASTATPTATITGQIDGKQGGKAAIQTSPTAEASAATRPPPPDQAPSGKPAETPIDSNGRFATTYRPGRGHLAAFEAAVARGLVPSAEREVVADVGSRYVPEFPLKVGQALSVRTDLERGKLPPTGGPLHMRIALQSTPERGAGRPRLAVHLVLDVSGSMRGEPISRARDAAQELVDKLEPNDDFSLVTFSTDAAVLVPIGPVGARRPLIAQAIRGVKEGGNTNIGRGLELSYREATSRTAPDEAIPLVLLLSDGQPTTGLKDPEELTKLAESAFQHGIQTSTFGLGQAFDGALMSSIADRGSGAYYYLRDAAQIRSALSTEIEKRVDPVATAVEVRVWLESNVELLHAYGTRRLDDREAQHARTSEIAADRQAEKRDGIERDRRDDIEGGMRFFIPAFARDDSHAILLKLRAPPAGPQSPLRIGVVEVKYKDRVFGKNVFEDATIWAPYAGTVEESSHTLDTSVARTVQGFAAGEALTEAATRIAHADRPGAIALLTEREARLREAADVLDEPRFSKDADRLALLRGHAGTQSGVGQPLVLSMLLETAGRSRLR